MTSLSSEDEPQSSSGLARVVSGSLAKLLRSLGLRSVADPRVSEDEIKVLLREGLRSGVFEESELRIVERVFRLGDIRASELMTPMSEVVWLDVTDPPEVMKRRIQESPHSRFPVCEGSIDNILGIVQVKDLLVQSFGGQPFGIAGMLKMPLLIYERTQGLKILDMFKLSGMHMAIVLDEYGSVRGLMTLIDILEAIVGDMPVGEDAEPARIVEREPGAWLVDGRVSLDELRDVIGINDLPEGDYQTLAGFVIAHIGHIPSPGDQFELAGRRHEVIEMQGHRVDKVLISNQPTG